MSGRRLTPRGTFNRWGAWIVLLLLASLARLPAADWDAGIAAHPDERFLLGVAQATPLWGDPCAASPDFPYGHLPVLLGRLLVLAAPSADPLFAARLLSALVGILLVAITGALGRELAGTRGALVAAAVMALAPFLIQQARFFTVDPWGAAFASAALLVGMRRRWLAAGALAGGAVACKLSLAWVGLPLLLAAFVGRRWHGVGRLLAGGALAFALAAPWAILRPVACWRGPLAQAGLVAGRYVVPYTKQYAGTRPFSYPLAQMAGWGLGPAAVLAGGVALGFVVWHWRQLEQPARLLWGWTVLYFVVTAGLYVKFPRYLLPIYPAWAAWAAWLVRRSPWGRGLLVGLTALLGLAQLAIHGQPHPWEVASRVIYAQVPEGAIVAVELWDHALPVPLPGHASDGYRVLTLPVFDDETAEKAAELARAAEEADVIVLASRRGYGALARQPERYAETLAWYRQMLVERDAVIIARCPRLGPVALVDAPLQDAGLPVPDTLAARCSAPLAWRWPGLDESFRVYDAPTVVLLFHTESRPRSP